MLMCPEQGVSQTGTGRWWGDGVMGRAGGSGRGGGAGRRQDGLPAVAMTSGGGGRQAPPVGRWPRRLLSGVAPVTVSGSDGGVAVAMVTA